MSEVNDHVPTIFYLLCECSDKYFAKAALEFYLQYLQGVSFTSRGCELPAIQQVHLIH